VIGIDIINIDRIKKSLKSAVFAKKTFTPAEILYAESKADSAQTYAGLFAAKEATVKALGTGFTGLNLEQIEIKHSAQGQPFAVVDSKEIKISISHDSGFAVAVAIVST